MTQSKWLCLSSKGFNDIVDFEVTDTNGLELCESPPDKRKYFCNCCGAAINSKIMAKPGSYRLSLGALDTAIVERQISHNFVNSKANCQDLGALLPRYERYDVGRE